MRKAVLLGVVGGVALALLTVLGGGGGTTSADGGPHVIESGATPDKCAACHRIHRSVPQGSSGVGSPTPVPVAIADQADPKVYTTSNYFSTGPVNGIQMSSWCATCHTRYLAGSIADSGDAIFKYRHRSNGSLGTACIKCHAPHGTNAGASGTYSSTVGYPGGGSGTTSTAESRLLKMDNRGICIKCPTDKK